MHRCGARCAGGRRSSGTVVLRTPILLATNVPVVVIGELQESFNKCGERLRARGERGEGHVRSQVPSTERREQWLLTGGD